MDPATSEAFHVPAAASPGVRIGAAVLDFFLPVLLGLGFFLVLTPVALVLRAVGKDPLRLKRDPATRSYWIPRTPAGPGADGMRTQF